MGVESTVKLSIGNYKSLKQIAEETGMSVREVADAIVSEGLSNAKDIGKAVSGNGNLLSQLQSEVNKTRAGHLKLQTRFEQLEAELGAEDEDEEPTTLTKADLLNPKRAVKPGELKEGQEHYCKDCFNSSGEYVWLDADEKPENCPKCGRKINWGEESGGSMGWIIAGVVALALLGGVNR